MAKRETKVAQRQQQKAESERNSSAVDSVLGTISMVGAAGLTVTGNLPMAGAAIMYGSGTLASAIERSAKAKALEAKATATDTLVKGQTKLGALYGREAPGAYIDQQARAKAEAPATSGSQVRPAAGVPTGSGPVDVPGYTRADGVTVKGYTRQRGDR